jgi:hypothetical protein
MKAINPFIFVSSLFIILACIAETLPDQGEHEEKTTSPVAQNLLSFEQNKKLLNVDFTGAADTANLSRKETSVTRPKNTSIGEELQSILEKLWATSFEGKLSEQITLYKDNDIDIMSYDPKGNKVFIHYNEEHLEKLRKLDGNNWRDGIAAVLGHELAHYKKGRQSKAGFLSGEKNYDNPPESRDEEEADIFGIFIAHLAGYDGVAVFPSTIENLYIVANIDTAATIKYPSLSDRQKTVRKAMQQVQGLIRLFKSGTYLSVLGKYDLAEQCFQVIKTTGYSGAEIHFLSGLNNLLRALNDKDTPSKYIWPITLEERTPLSRKSYPHLGAVSVQSSAKAAIAHFKKALSQRSEYPEAHLNLMIAYAQLPGQQNILNEHFQQITLQSVKEKAKIVKHLYTLEHGTAKERRTSLSKLQALADNNGESPYIKQLVLKNIDIHNGTPDDKVKSSAKIPKLSFRKLPLRLETCESFKLTKHPLDKRKIYICWQKGETSTDMEVHIEFPGKSAKLKASKVSASSSSAQKASESGLVTRSGETILLPSNQQVMLLPKRLNSGPVLIQVEVK